MLKDLSSGNYDIYCSNMTLRHYEIVCGLYVVHCGSLFGNMVNVLFYISLKQSELCGSLCCPNYWELQYIHQLGDGIWALYSFPHCLFHGGGKRRRREGVESFIHKPFHPHLLVCHRMSGCDTEVTQHELESGHWFKPSRLETGIVSQE